MNTAIVILAAGKSSRLGKPKQLLKYKEQTLLQIVTHAALNAQFHPVIVVLGAYADQIKALHNHPDVIYIVNEQWEKGMSSSIGIGVKKVLKAFNNTENVIITVADQAHITADVFTALYKKYQTDNKNIVTSSYLKTTGTPTLFNKKYFSTLVNLQGPFGAKEVLKQNIDDTACVPFELGGIDIDTEIDYKKLINHK